MSAAAGAWVRTADRLPPHSESVIGWWGEGRPTAVIVLHDELGELGEDRWFEDTDLYDEIDAQPLMWAPIIQPKGAAA